jgi:cell division cycle 20-like protein 1 (cofactor of APC complex)
MKRPELTFEHKGAVKGLAWHPSRRGILASGGGNSDYCIKMWNTKSNELVKKVNTGSQVCNLMYINDGENLVSTHGFNQFETNIW